MFPACPCPRSLTLHPHLLRICIQDNPYLLLGALDHNLRFCFVIPNGCKESPGERNSRSLSAVEMTSQGCMEYTQLTTTCKLRG